MAFRPVLSFFQSCYVSASVFITAFSITRFPVPTVALLPTFPAVGFNSSSSAYNTTTPLMFSSFSSSHTSEVDLHKNIDTSHNTSSVIAYTGSHGKKTISPGSWSVAKPVNFPVCPFILAPSPSLQTAKLFH